MLINLELPERITEESHRLKTCEVKHWSSSNKSREGLSFYELIKRSCLYKSLHGWEEGITITPRQKCQASLVMQESCYVAMTRLVHFPNLRLYAIFLCTTKQPHLFYPFSKLSPSPPFFLCLSHYFIVSRFLTLSVVFPFLCLCYGTHDMSTCLWRVL